MDRTYFNLDWYKRFVVSKLGVIRIAYGLNASNGP